MARPTKFSPELSYRLCMHLQYGASHRMAAEAEGIERDSFTRWLKNKPGFAEAVTRAEATARTENLRLLNLAAAHGSVKAITWLLERLDPETFAPPAQRHEHSGPGGGAMELVHIYLPANGRETRAEPATD